MQLLRASPVLEPRQEPGVSERWRVETEHVACRELVVFCGNSDPSEPDRVLARIVCDLRVAYRHGPAGREHSTSARSAPGPGPVFLRVAAPLDRADRSRILAVSAKIEKRPRQPGLRPIMAAGRGKKRPKMVRERASPNRPTRRSYRHPTKMLKGVVVRTTPRSNRVGSRSASARRGLAYRASRACSYGDGRPSSH